ncbi:MAG: gamma-glutamyl-gamma-aminobutyrate hydrolase family protein [Myxococcota bacterium]|nr:gamma-glutamyl-gamma-aminobutyrate hydrolase family protein [Myxococcota bacterium]
MGFEWVDGRVWDSFNGKCTLLTFMAEIALLDFNDGHPNLGCEALRQTAIAHGHDVKCIDVRGGQPLPKQFDAVLTSGGPGSPLEDSAWSGPLFEWLGNVLENATPILAICYGFQMLSRVSGGQLVAQKNSRFGIYELSATEAGKEDPWLAPAVPSAVFLQHRFVLKSLNAQVLAMGSEGDVLAARFGRAAVGCMFHPEACPETARRWFENPDIQKKLEERLGTDRSEAMVRNIPFLERSNRALLHGFLSCLS